MSIRYGKLLITNTHTTPIKNNSNDNEINDCLISDSEKLLINLHQIIKLLFLIKHTLAQAVIINTKNNDRNYEFSLNNQYFFIIIIILSTRIFYTIIQKYQYYNVYIYMYTHFLQKFVIY